MGRRGELPVLEFQGFDYPGFQDMIQPVPHIMGQ